MNYNYFYIIAITILLIACNTRTIYRYPNGTKKYMSVKNKDGILIRDKSWYEDGKLESRFKIIKLDSVTLYDTCMKDTLIWIDVKCKGYVRYNTGQRKERHEVLSNGDRKIEYYCVNGKLEREETWRNNTILNSQIFCNCDSVIFRK